jgi:hypothetical protein
MTNVFCMSCSGTAADTCSHRYLAKVGSLDRFHVSAGTDNFRPVKIPRERVLVEFDMGFRVCGRRYCGQG